MVATETVVLLIEPGEAPSEVFATIKSAYSQDHNSARAEGSQAGYTFEIWAEEYDDQSQVEHLEKRYKIVRTYERNDGKIELHTEERKGIRGGC